MEIGDFRHRIVIQNLVALVNENGFEIEEWQNYKVVWASVSNLSGREYYQAAAIKAEKTIKFLIRYIEGIETSMRILFDNKQYNIVFIDNLKYKNQYIELKVLEEVVNG